MAVQGIVSPIADHDALAYAGPEWVAAVKSISPQIAYAKCSIGSGVGGIFHADLLTQGAQAYADAGVPLQFCLEFNLAPPEYTGQANAIPDRPTIYGGLKVTRFAEDWTSVVISILRGLPAALLPAKGVLIGNEPNLQAAAQTLGTGQTIPYLAPGMNPDPTKPSAMAPECYFSFLYYAASRIHKAFPQLAIYPAALSLDAAFNTSMTDGWIGQYYATGMQHLLSAGLKEPWPWSGFVANIEGVVTQKYAQYVAYGASHLKGAWGIVGPNIWAEWSVPAQHLDVPTMADTYHNLAATCSMMTFFQAQTKTPGVLTDYGVFDYSYAGGVFVPKQSTAWFAALGSMLGGDR